MVGARQQVGRNVAALVKLPPLRKRKGSSWTSDEARTFLEAARADTDPLYAAYVLVLVLGLRRGEVLGLTWKHIAWDGWDKPCRQHTTCFCKQCRDDHDISLNIDKQLQRVRGKLLHRATKTEESDAPLPLPAICVTALRLRQLQQAAAREKAGAAWHDAGMIFTTRYGQPVEPRNFNRSYDGRRLRRRAGIQERALGGSQPGIALRDGPFPGQGQPGAAQQRAGFPVQVGPDGRRLGQLTMKPQGLTVLAEPLPQARPGPDQRLVGDLNRGVADDKQARPRQSFNDVGVVVGVQFRTRHAAPGVLGSLPERDQPQQKKAGDLPLVGVERLVNPLGSTRDRPFHPAGRLVPGERQLRALPLSPGLQQRMGHPWAARPARCRRQPGSWSAAHVRRSDRPASRGR